MENKKRTTGRDIISSNFEVAPYDPYEYEYSGDQKCRGQIIVNKLEKTITFRHISGTKPVFYVVLVAMSINKNWCRIFKPWECEDKYKDHMLLIRDWPAAYYVAHTEENGLPVIEKEIEHVPYFLDVEEFTLSELEYYLLAEFKGVLNFSAESRRKIKRRFAKEWEFKFIR